MNDNASISILIRTEVDTFKDIFFATLLDKVTVFSLLIECWYRSGTVKSNTVNSNFHLIRSYCEIFFYHVPTISC